MPGVQAHQFSELRRAVARMGGLPKTNCRCPHSPVTETSLKPVSLERPIWIQPKLGTMPNKKCCPKPAAAA
eukprot:950510-Pyramimonas_sp.AAC.1